MRPVNTRWNHPCAMTGPPLPCFALPEPAGDYPSAFLLGEARWHPNDLASSGAVVASRKLHHTNRLRTAPISPQRSKISKSARAHLLPASPGSVAAHETL